MKFGKKVIIGLSFLAAISIFGNAKEGADHSQHIASTKETSFLESYANIAFDNYTQALDDAKKLQIAIDKFVKKPTQSGLDEAKKAWLNIANGGKFSSDRTILEYANEIWNIKQIKVK